MKQNFILASFGIILGLGLLLLFKPLIPHILGTKTAGTHFESISDFQKAMLSRDTRDQQDGNSVSLRSIITPHHNDAVMYDLIPNLNVKFQRANVRINNCGMRGKDVDIGKDENTIRIAFLGDSFTFGWGVEEHQAFTSVTEDVLNRFLDDKKAKVEVLNFGVPGYSTFQEAAQFLETGINFSPDIVVVFFIDNDFGLPFFISSVAGNGQVVSSSKFAAISSGKDVDPKHKAERDRIHNMLDPNRALKKLALNSKENGYKLYLAFNPHPNWKSSYKRLWFLRESDQISMINQRPRFLAAMHEFNLKPEELSLSHDPHPSPYKHAMLGALLAESLFEEVSLISNLIEESN